MDGYEKSEMLGLNIITENTLPRASVFQENFEILEKASKPEIYPTDLKGNTDNKILTHLLKDSAGDICVFFVNSAGQRTYEWLTLSSIFTKNKDFDDFKKDTKEKLDALGEINFDGEVSSLTSLISGKISKGDVYPGDVRGNTDGKILTRLVRDSSGDLLMSYINDRGELKTDWLLMSNVFVKNEDMNSFKTDIQKKVDALSEINFDGEVSSLTSLISGKISKGEVLPTDVRGNTDRQLLTHSYVDNAGDVNVYYIDKDGNRRSEWLMLSNKFANKDDVSTLQSVISNKATLGDILPTDLKGNTDRQIVTGITKDSRGDILVTTLNERGELRTGWTLLSDAFANKTKTEDDLQNIKDAISAQQTLFNNFNREYDNDMSRLQSALNAVERIM